MTLHGWEPHGRAARRIASIWYKHWRTAVRLYNCIYPVQTLGEPHRRAALQLYLSGTNIGGAAPPCGVTAVRRDRWFYTACQRNPPAYWCVTVPFSPIANR